MQQKQAHAAAGAVATQVPVCPAVPPVPARWRPRRGDAGPRSEAKLRAAARCAGEGRCTRQHAKKTRAGSAPTDSCVLPARNPCATRALKRCAAGVPGQAAQKHLSGSVTVPGDLLQVEAENSGRKAGDGRRASNASAANCSLAGRRPRALFHLSSLPTVGRGGKRQSGGNFRGNRGQKRS